ncbi:hypothetical protein [Sporomusa rhizae]|uniref:hypothetical protein n=1 Tax=Sporomusa rhizae TaxID=357999 RepID=UPI003529DD01
MLEAIPVCLNQEQQESGQLTQNLAQANGPVSAIYYAWQIIPFYLNSINGEKPGRPFSA